MAKISISGFIHAIPATEWDTGTDVVDGHRMTFSVFDDMSDHGWVEVCPYTLEFSLPEGWDPRAQQIEALKAQKEKLKREFAESVMRIDTQISRLQAIEYAPPVTVGVFDEVF